MAGSGAATLKHKRRNHARMGATAAAPLTGAHDLAGIGPAATSSHYFAQNALIGTNLAGIEYENNIFFSFLT